MVSNGDYNIDMLPKIIVAVAFPRLELLKQNDLWENQVLSFEGSEAKVVEFRRWLYTGINVTQTRSELSLLIWNADQLSPECQAVLLKPMEEMGKKARLILVVENENQLSPTILSRGVIEYQVYENLAQESQWSAVRKCWSSGPAACVALADRVTKEGAVVMLEEVILKLKTSLSDEVNKKRLSILSLAIDCLHELKQTNINYKLSLDNFLITSWRMIKS
jgi:hypothetical protein